MSFVCRPEYPEEETEEENFVEDDSELQLNEIEKTMMMGVSLIIAWVSVD